MKKTLFTLAALAVASVAQAASTTTWLSDPSGVKTGSFSTAINGSEQAYTMMFFMDWNEAFSDASTSYDGDGAVALEIYHSNNNNTDKWWKTSVRIGTGNTTDTLYIGITLDGQNRYLNDAGGAHTAVNSWLYEMKYDNYAIDGKVGFALRLDDEKLTLSALKNDGESIGSVYTTLDPNGNSWTINKTIDRVNVVNPLFSHAVIVNEKLDDPTLISTMSTAIPEPATATLSLLALAGLAARRRRK